MLIVADQPHAEVQRDNAKGQHIDSDLA